MEIWKKVKNFEDYEVSSQGRVRSLKFNKIKIMKPKRDKDGYLKLILFEGKLNRRKRSSFMIHRLVAQIFCEKPEFIENLQVDHINNKKRDNRAKNLRWVTPKQNSNNRTLKIKLNLENINKIISLYKKGFKEKSILKQLKNKKIEVRKFG